jgi:CRP-like cAMP-binding protein
MTSPDSAQEQTVDVAPNQTIIEQGEQGRGFFILQSGTLEVFKDGVLLAVLMYPGTIFGEMGDILGKPRTCTVRAKNQAKVLHVAAHDFAGYLREHPDTALKIIKTLASRLERTTQKLADTTRESPLWTIKK